MKKKSLSQLQYELYKQSQAQRNQAWYEKDFYKSMKLREEEQKTFQKTKLVQGLIRANEKQKREGKK